MVANTVLPHLWWFWHWICGHRALKPFPLGPAKVPPSPNQYGRQQDCGFECPMGFPQQASAHQHEILYQRPTFQPKLAYAQETSTIAIHRNTDRIWPKKPVTPDKDISAPPVTRTPQAHSQNIGSLLYSAHNKIRQWYTLNNLLKCSWTMLPPTTMMALSIVWVRRLKLPLKNDVFWLWNRVSPSKFLIVGMIKSDLHALAPCASKSSESLSCQNWC